MHCRATMVLVACLAGVAVPIAESPGDARGAAQAASASDLGINRVATTFAGTWSIVERREAIAGVQKAETVRGEEVWRLAPGGMPLIEEYHTRSENGEDFGYGVFWPDKAAGQMRGLFCDPTEMRGCRPFEMHWEGKSLVLDGEGERAGARFRWREVLTPTGPDAFTQAFDVGDPEGRPTMRVLTITATRAVRPRG